MPYMVKKLILFSYNSWVIISEENPGH